jgi:imidazolonepropionase-like amidohydrolase
MMMRRSPILVLLALGTAACASGGSLEATPSPVIAQEATQGVTDHAPLFPDPFPSTYQPVPSGTTAIRNATILTGTGERIQGGTVLIEDGKITAVGTAVSVPADATILDAAGKWVTPGVIDTHSHLGVYASPGVSMQSDGNELTSPNTAQVWAEHSIWPHDPGFGYAIAGGVTALQILPGSGNLFGGRGVTVKPVPSRTYQGMKFPGAPHALKMACGENPKRVYGSQGRAPGSAMGNVAGYREAWISASAYLKGFRTWIAEGSDPAKEPTRNLQNETLAGVLNGDIRVHNHCYRADEMVTMIDVANEFGYSIASFHHAVEAYKIRDILAQNDICASMWSDWWGFKHEAYDGIKENVALVHESGACTIVHSDDGHGIQRLNQESAKVLGAAARVGIDIPVEDAIAWITLNPARAIGIDDVTGSLEVGKNADITVWSGDPFSVYTKAEHVFIDGAHLYDRANPDPRLWGDWITEMLPGGGEVIR